MYFNHNVSAHSAGRPGPACVFTREFSASASEHATQHGDSESEPKGRFLVLELSFLRFALVSPQTRKFKFGVGTSS